MKNTIRILFLFLSVFTFSCEKRGLFVNCDECTAIEPSKAVLKMKLDRHDYGVSTIINVYTGNLEDSILYNTFTTSSTEATLSVSINQKYTVTATYYIPDIHYVAVDSATPRVTYNKDQCTDPCYYVYDKVVDLRLKYTK